MAAVEGGKCPKCEAEDALVSVADDEDETGEYGGMLMCTECGEEMMQSAGGGDESKEGGGGGRDRVVVCSITDVDGVPMKGKKGLKCVELDVGGEDTVKVVTSAKVEVGMRTVVALSGATITDPETGDDITVKKTVIAGAPSEGMLCDGPMLGWKGGAAGAAAKIPASFALGSAPPTTRPRMDA